MTREQIKEFLLDMYTTILPGKPVPEWFEVLAFCDGYYGKITVDMVSVVREMQREGYIK